MTSPDKPVRASRRIESPDRPTLAGAFVARLYDPFLALGERRGMRALRRDLLSGARGRVLEVGAGTGHNLDAYPARLDELVLTEPDAGMRARLRRRAACSGRDVTVVATGAEAMPFPDDRFDTVVCTLVLCTVADPAAAVAELRRVLRPGGRLLFIEHVRAADARLARRQDRLAGAWRAFAAGCNCNRDTVALVGDRFGATDARTAVWRGMPRIVAPLVVGAAR